jgi:hypothetical protein
MVLYLRENMLFESVSADKVADAIDRRVGVLVTYEGEDNPHHGTRYIEPYVYGITSAGNPAIRAYQYYGDTKKGVPAWKLMRLDRFTSWEPTDSHFDIEPKARGWAAEAFNGNDRKLVKVIKTVELGEEPMTDLEKLKARTRQIKQSKPININQLNQDKKNPVSQRKNVHGGPIGQNTPDTGTPNPAPETKTVQTPTPVNTDGTQKNDVTQPPVKQEPKQSGPVVNDKQGQEKKPDELMSNDEFMNMLRRNLERTDKEKAKRGFSLSNNQG